MRAAFLCDVVLLAGLAGALSGCPEMFGPNEPQHPGKDIGVFTVHATLAESSCGIGAFESQESWDFQVRLSREGKTLYWNNGAQYLQGKVQDDNASFSFEYQQVIKIDSRINPRYPCMLERADSAQGLLKGTSAETQAFTGVLRYAFTPQGKSDCTDALADQGALTLPCAIIYDMKGTKTAQAK